jgi:hypothetical protein
MSYIQVSPRRNLRIKHPCGYIPVDTPIVLLATKRSERGELHELCLLRQGIWLFVEWCGGDTLRSFPARSIKSENHIVRKTDKPKIALAQREIVDYDMTDNYVFSLVFSGQWMISMEHYINTCCEQGLLGEGWVHSLESLGIGIGWTLYSESSNRNKICSLS